MGNYQGYQKYKDSGVEWLGDIPEHWEAIKGKFIFCILSGYAPADFIFEDEGINYYQVDDLNDDSDIFLLRKSSKHIKQINSSLILDAPFILFPKRGAAIATNKVKIVDKDSVFDTNLMGIKTNSKSCPKFISYVILSRGLWDIADVSTVPQINNKHINPLFFPLPSLNEQEKIAQFLDYKTKQIDELIKKKETLIEKLDEKRTALISHAVTKGLDSSVPMKDSGIEWLGEIPKHWKIIPIKRFSQIYDCKHKTVSFVDDGIPVASIAQVQNFYIDLLIAKMTTKEEFIEMIEGGRKPQNGDIILSRNATVGASAIVQDDLFCMGQDVCLIRPVKANSVFLNYNFLAFFTKSQIDTCLLGSTFKRINVEEVKNLLICLPLLEEQKQIAQYLDQKTAQIDQQKAKIKEAIELLKEYRTSLITNAVTGKIDVRQVAIP